MCKANCEIDTIPEDGEEAFVNVVKKANRNTTVAIHGPFRRHEEGLLLRREVFIVIYKSQPLGGKQRGARIKDADRQIRR